MDGFWRLLVQNSSAPQGMIEGMVTGLWDLSGLTPGGAKNLYETARYGTAEAALMQMGRWETLGSALSSPLATGGAVIEEGWNSFNAYLDLLSLYEAQGAGWDYGFTQGKTMGEVAFDVASLFIGVGEIKTAIRLGDEVAGAGKILGEVTEGVVKVGDDAGKVTNEIIALTKSRFGHAFTTHGQEATEFLTKRAAGSGNPMGQFLDDQAAARLILDNLENLKNGAISVPVPVGFPARVIMPDGSFVPATSIRLVPGGNGVKTAYPEP